jgi:hypothetical protein
MLWFFLEFSYIQHNNGIFSYVFQHKDHLGNVRLSYAENTASAEETVFSDGFERGTVIGEVIGAVAGTKGANVATKAITTSLKANKAVNVFRVFGGDAKASGFSWTPKDPRGVANFRDAAGLPSGGASGAMNTAESLIQGTVKNKNIIQRRSALPLDGNKGGLPEYIIDPKNVNVKSTTKMN